MTITSRKSIVPVMAVISSALLLSACSTMKFVNGPEMEQTTEREQWHHLGLNGVVEFSRPMNLKYNCAQQQWDTATIEYSFLNMVASASPVIPVSLYSPWTIIYECREPID